MDSSVIAMGRDEESSTGRDDRIQDGENTTDCSIVQAGEEGIASLSFHEELAAEMHPGSQPGSSITSYRDVETENGVAPLDTPAEPPTPSSLNRIDDVVQAKTRTAPTDDGEFPFRRSSALVVPGLDETALTQTSRSLFSQIEPDTDADEASHDPGTSKWHNKNRNSLDRLESDIMEKATTRSKTVELESSAISGPGAISVGAKSSLDQLENDVLRKLEDLSGRGRLEDVYEYLPSRSVANDWTEGGNVLLSGTVHERSLKSGIPSSAVDFPLTLQPGATPMRGSATLNEMESLFLAKSSGVRSNMVTQHGEYIPGSLTAQERDLLRGATGALSSAQSVPDQSEEPSKGGAATAIPAFDRNNVAARGLGRIQTNLSLSFLRPFEEENANAPTSAIWSGNDPTSLHRNLAPVASSEDFHSFDQSHSFATGHNQAEINHNNAEVADVFLGRQPREPRMCQNRRMQESSSTCEGDDDDDDEENDCSHSTSSRGGGRSVSDMEQAIAQDIDAMVLEAEPVTMATSAFVVRETDEHESDRRRLKKYILRGSFAIAIVIAAVAIVAVTVSGRDDSTSGSNYIAPSQNTTRTQVPSFPSSSPSRSSAPTTDSRAEFLSFLQTMYGDESYFVKEFSSTDSAQYRAAIWVADEDLYPRKSFADQKVLQRFVLATFYFSTEGDDWNKCFRTDPICNGNLDETSWLSNEDECIWDSIDCEDGVNVSRIFFRSQADYALKGTLPPELAFLSVLETLIVSYNQIGGTIPEALSGWTNLRDLRVDSNRLGGTIPAAMILRNSLLGTMHVQHNRMTGTIPNTLTHASLRNIQMQGNFFRGSIPESIAEAVGLVTLNIEDNGLEGDMPTELHRLSDIAHLRLGGNHGLVGRLTPGVQAWSHIRELSVAGTQLGGTLPSELFNLTTLEVLDLGFASLSGSMPESFANLKDLMVLFLNNNTFSGTVPAAFEVLTNLATLEIHGNQVVGTISDAVCDLRGEKEFQLYSLSADCLATNGRPPLVSCDCCTSCYTPP